MLLAKSLSGLEKIFIGTATELARSWVGLYTLSIGSPSPAATIPKMARPPSACLAKNWASPKSASAVKGALGAARNPIPGAATPKVTVGLPGPLGVATKGLTVVGGVLAARELVEDIREGDVAGAIGSGASVVSSGLSTAGMVAGTFGGVGASAGLAVGGTVTGAFAMGYGVGTVLNEAFVEEQIDKLELGSGSVGEWYWRTFLK